MERGVKREPDGHFGNEDFNFILLALGRWKHKRVFFFASPAATPRFLLVRSDHK